jgi:hypothetical protein
MPRKVAKAKDGGVDKEKSVGKKVGVKKDGVKKDVVKKDVVKRGRKMRGGDGTLLQQIETALKNKPDYNTLFKNINNEFDKIKDGLKKKGSSIYSRTWRNDARNIHDNHINQITKFKSNNIKDIPSLLDLKNLLEYIKNIEGGYGDIDIKILYTNIIILYIYNFFELIKDIIENNTDAANIEVKDTPATAAAAAPTLATPSTGAAITGAATALATAVAPAGAAAAPTLATAVAPVSETDDAIIKRMKKIYNTNITKFNNIKSKKDAIYARFKGVIDNIPLATADYPQFYLKKYFSELIKSNYITDIKTILIKEIRDNISKLNTNGKLFNALYIDMLEDELAMFESVIDSWTLSINKIK